MLETWFAEAETPAILLYAAVFSAALGIAVLTVFVVLPVRRLVRQLAQFAPGREELKGFRFRNEAELLTQTFKLLTGELKSKEEELKRLYEQADARARFAENYSERLVESIPMGVVALTADGRVTTLNPAAEALFGVRLSAVAGKPHEELWGGQTSLGRLARMALETGAPTGRTEALWRGRDDSGEGRELQVTGSLLAGREDPSGKAIVFTLYDLTPVRQLEARIRTAERLAAVGTLSAGLAHEIRNPLSAILGYSNLLKRRVEGSGEPAELAATVEKEAQGLNRVVNEFLEFVRKHEMAREPLDWSAVLAELPGRLGRVLKEREVRLITNDPPVEANCGLDRTLAIQVLYNLVLNAVEASPPGGEVSVSVEIRTGEALPWVVTVGDGGPGIPEDVRRKAFDPFFTTKPDGVGLGLSIVHRIVTEAKGTVELESRPGRGTLAVVRLPEA
jgi:PAS domain S-box-containing protein